MEEHGNNKRELFDWPQEKLREVKLKEPDDFLKIMETLERVGVVAPDGKTLVQICHILHKRGRYYIVHFKEMLLLDLIPIDTTRFDEDIKQRDIIVELLAQWGLIDDPKPSGRPVENLHGLKIVPFKYKDQWKLKANYSIGSNTNERKH